jgi:hypothetical protein
MSLGDSPDYSRPDQVLKNIIPRTRLFAGKYLAITTISTIIVALSILGNWQRLRYSSSFTEFRGYQSSMKHRYLHFFRLIKQLSIIFIVLASFFSAPAIPTRADDAGYALAFDGENDLVRLAETGYIMASTWKDTKTVELWVKPEGPAVTCPNNIVGTCDSILGDKPVWWGISRGIVAGQDRIWVFNWDGSAGSAIDQIGIPYTAGEWTHIAMVHDGGTLRAYKNGDLVGSVASGTTQQPNTGALPVLYLGGIIVTSSRNYTFQGQIDEVRLWNVARSETEIDADMQQQLIGNETGLAAYYQMSDGSGLTLTDDSLNNWNGTLLDGDAGVLPNGLPPQWVDSGAFDPFPPTVTINQAVGQADPTNAAAIVFDVVFSEPVTGFSNSDVDLSASTTPGTLIATVSGSGASYTVAVSGMTGNGIVIAAIPANAAQSGFGLGNRASTSTDNQVTYDIVPPSVTINQAPGQPDPTNASPINFQVVFSEAVSNFTGADVNLSASTAPGALSAVVTGSGTTYNVAVSGMTGNGQVIAAIPAGVAQDAAGNANTVGSSEDNLVNYIYRYEYFLPLMIR